MVKTMLLTFIIVAILGFREFLFFLKIFFFNLFMIDTQREREREAET